MHITWWWCIWWCTCWFVFCFDLFCFVFCFVIKRKNNYFLLKKRKLNDVNRLPGVGVRCPVEFGREVIIRCDCGWLKWLIFVDALFIVVIDNPLEFCTCPIWWSRGGDTGSDFTFIGIGDVAGGGVLFDTANCVIPLKKNNIFLFFFSPKYYFQLQIFIDENGTLCVEQYLYYDDSNSAYPLLQMNSLKNLVVQMIQYLDMKTMMMLNQLYLVFVMLQPEYLVMLVADAAVNIISFFYNIFHLQIYERFI